MWIFWRTQFYIHHKFQHHILGGLWDLPQIASLHLLRLKGYLRQWLRGSNFNSFFSRSVTIYLSQLDSSKTHGKSISYNSLLKSMYNYTLNAGRTVPITCYLETINTSLNSKLLGRISTLASLNSPKFNWRHFQNDSELIIILGVFIIVSPIHTQLFEQWTMVTLGWLIGP